MTRVKSLYWVSLLTLAFVMIWYSLIFRGDWNNLWLTKDQRAYQLYEQSRFQDAAKVFDDSSFKASAYFKAGEFKKAAALFSTMNTAPSRYNQANALLMMGKYDKAIEMYDLALKLQPEFKKAKENRLIAEARKKRIDQERDNDEGTGGKLGADKIVYDNKNKRGEDHVEQSSEQTGNVANWLDRLQTGPGDFLKHKFGYQYAQQQNQNKQGREP